MKQAILAVAVVIGCITWAPSRIAAQSADATLIVTVTGVHDTKGHVRVAVCTRAEFLQPHCAYHASVPAQAGRVTVAIPGISPGVYAVQAWHDWNDNGRIDRNFFGFPTESMGFSRDAPMHFGPPRFDDAALQLPPGGSRISLQLHDF